MSLLLKIGPCLSVFEVQRDLLDGHQVEIFPRQSVALLVFDSQIPVMGAIVLSERDLQTIAVRQCVLPEDIFSPFVGAVRRYVQRMDLDACLVDERKILIPCARGSSSH